MWIQWRLRYTTQSTPKGTIYNRFSKLLENFEADYIYKVVFGFNRKGKLFSDIILGTVTKRDLHSDIKSWQVETREITTTTYTDRYGHRSSNSTSTVVNVADHRRSKIKGYLVLETPQGNQVAYQPSSEQLSNSDVGDHILIFRSILKLKNKKTYEFEELYYNLSKNRYWTPSGIKGLEFTGITKHILILMAISAAISYFYSKGLAIAISIAMILIIIKVTLVFFSNSKKLDEIAEPLVDKFNQTQQNRENWVKILD